MSTFTQEEMEQIADTLPDEVRAWIHDYAAQQERETCARLCDAYAEISSNTASRRVAVFLAESIRARGDS